MHITTDEIRRRDALMRAWFAGRDWTGDPEFDLKRDLVARSAELLPDHPYVIDDEWHVSPGFTNSGVGDLLFTDGENSFAVVEVKFIDHASSGRTAKTTRRKRRRSVEEQAVTYAGAVRERFPGAEVQAYYFTNDPGVTSPIRI